MGIFDKLFKRNKDNVEEKEEEQKIEELKQDEIKEEEIKQEEEKIEEIKEIEKVEIEEIIETKEVEKEEIEETEKVEESVGFFKSLGEKLFKSREGLFSKIKNFITNRSIIDDEMYEELEDMLIQSDIGMDMTVKIVKDLEKEVKKRKVTDPNEVYSVLKEVMENYLIDQDNKINLEEGKLNIILIVGVNGVGKTTTIGKMASKYVKQGKKVVVGAGDTFRAAAVEQLEEWANRAGAIIVKGKEGADPGAVVYDSIQKAEEISADVLIIDTAGRLHNKAYLMKELEKVKNVIKKKIGDSFYETILVIDGTTGQNGLNQAKEFNEVTNLTGFIITKLDGTAKGGIVFSISETLKKPIKFIGVGEKIEDLREFNVKEYIAAIFE